MDKDNLRRDALVCCFPVAVLFVGWLKLLVGMEGLNLASAIPTGLVALASGSIFGLLRRLPRWKDSDAQAWRALRNRSCVILMLLVTAVLLGTMNSLQWHSVLLAAILFVFLGLILPPLLLLFFTPLEALLTSASLGVAESVPHRPSRKKRRK